MSLATTVSEWKVSLKKENKTKTPAAFHAAAFRESQKAEPDKCRGLPGTRALSQLLPTALQLPCSMLLL